MPHDRLGLVLDETGVTSHPPRPRHRGRIALLLVIAVVIGGGWFASQFLVESIRTPILMGSAGDDVFVSPKAHRRMAAALPDCRLSSFPEGKHELFMETDDIRRRWLADIADFIFTRVRPQP